MVAKVGAQTSNKGEGAGRGCPPRFAHTGMGTSLSESPDGDLALMGIKKQEKPSVRHLQ